MKNGDLLHNPATQSHEDLIQLYNLQDSKVGNFAKVEFYPDDNIDLGDISKYKLHIDDDIIPEWFDDSIRESTERKLRVILKRIVITDHRKILIGGCYLLAGNAKVDVIKNTHIIQMWGSSRVGEMWGSSSIGEMRSSSSVGKMWDFSSIGAMYDSSSIGAMWDSSKIINDDRSKD